MDNKIVVEKKQGNHTYYQILDYDPNKHAKCNKRIVYHLIKTIIDENNNLTVFIFDDENENVKEAYYFLNHDKREIGDSSRLSLAWSLSVSLNYARIIEKSLNTFQYKDFLKYAEFLRGGVRNSGNTTFYLNASRDSKTIRSILKTLQSYLKYCKTKNYKLLDRVAAKTHRQEGPVNLAPKFISYADMLNIHNYVINDFSLIEETRLKYDVIYRLMFDCGLRIGEVLGLTIEDLRKAFSEDGDLIHIAKIRNRCSDSLHQHAKRCFQVKDPADYQSVSYKSRNTGFQEVLIPETLYKDLIKYYDKASMRFFRQELEMPKADSVDSNNANYYIFANERNNNPLTKTALTKYTRNVFMKVGITVDTERRQINLFHRFRHGFCMWLIFVKKMPTSQVIRYTRHRTIEALSPYLNPTQEMITEVLKEAQEGIDIYE